MTSKILNPISSLKKPSKNEKPIRYNRNAKIKSQSLRENSGSGVKGR